MHILITGGAGFIGCNAAADFLRSGDAVTVLDDLSRAGSEDNLAWLRTLGPLGFVRADVRDADAVHQAIASGARPVDAVLHLAAQVAVTTSVEDPRRDFEINALGTLNVLEAVRACPRRPALLFSSTNKVYGALEDLEVAPRGQRYVGSLSTAGIGEERPLDFHSPYGCSKGAADQYVRDYARIYGLRTVVLRQSCIYGHRQFGIEEQGWMAWFTLAALLGREVTIYGDGLQVRDLLEVSDLVRLFRCCLERIDEVQGEVLNAGGGPENALSILEALDLLGEELGAPVARTLAPWRPGDQKVFISCNRRAAEFLGWRPEVGTREGVRRLVAWIRPNLELIRGRVQAG